MVASALVDDVSTRIVSLLANPGSNLRCLRARTPMIASAYTYKAGLQHVRQQK